MEEDKPKLPLFTTIAVGCSSCPKSKYQVSDACRSCFARPCSTNCPKDAIEYVTDKALFNGTTATTFSPNEGMTRGMFVTVLGRMAGADISAYNTQSQFADVDSKMYYNAYVNWAAANKIVSGVDASHFNPNALITREQAAVIMDNYLTATGTKVEETGSAAAFADSASIRAYAKDAVTRMQKAGLLSGKSGNRFDPQGTATRAQVAVIMQKLCEKTGK